MRVLIYILQTTMCYNTSFFFSSRRRHTRSKRDWSSDVCSSDLNRFTHTDTKPGEFSTSQMGDDGIQAVMPAGTAGSFEPCLRSEERRVGKECRYWWWPCV